MVKYAPWQHTGGNCFALSGQITLLTIQPRAALRSAPGFLVLAFQAAICRAKGAR
jgi:hypothetical protein